MLLILHGSELFICGILLFLLKLSRSKNRVSEACLLLGLIMLQIFV